MARSIAAAMMWRSSRSRCTVWPTPGRCTFTTTCCSPSVVSSTARCTCPIDAVASGLGSKLTYTSSSDAPRLVSITSLISSKGTGGTSSCSFFSSTMSSGGSTSERVETIWPSLMNDGPRSCSTRRTRSWIEMRFFSSSPFASSSLGIASASEAGLSATAAPTSPSLFFGARPKPARATISPKP